MGIVIRKATVHDAGQVADVINAVISEGKYTLFDKPFSEEAERAFISSRGERSAIFIAEIDGRIVGVQSIDLFIDFAESLRHVATMGTWLCPDVRGRGVAQFLAEESFAFARTNGYRKIVIQVLADNEKALRFYRKLGFQDIGIARQHVRLGDQFHDEVYLEKFL